MGGRATATREQLAQVLRTSSWRRPSPKVDPVDLRYWKRFFTKRIDNMNRRIPKVEEDIEKLQQAQKLLREVKCEVKLEAVVLAIIGATDNKKAELANLKAKIRRRREMLKDRIKKHESLKACSNEAVHGARH